MSLPVVAPALGVSSWPVFGSVAAFSDHLRALLGDAVIETVGEATWAHSLRALKPGGALVVSGATSGDAPSAELTRTFFLQLRVLGSTMGSKQELERLVQLCASGAVTPVIDRTIPLADARDGFAAMAAGDLFGKVVLTV